MTRLGLAGVQSAILNRRSSLLLGAGNRRQANRAIHQRHSPRKRPVTPQARSDLLPFGLYRRPRSFTGSWEEKQWSADVGPGLAPAMADPTIGLTTDLSLRFFPRGLYRRSGIGSLSITQICPHPALKVSLQSQYSRCGNRERSSRRARGHARWLWLASLCALREREAHLMIMPWVTGSPSQHCCRTPWSPLRSNLTTNPSTGCHIERQTMARPDLTLLGSHQWSCGQTACSLSAITA